MKKLVLIIFIFFSFFKAQSFEDFNFDVTEIEVLDKGNKFIGSKGGKVTFNNGIEINAKQFEYDKSTNILKAVGNVISKDIENNYTILSNEVIYNRQTEIIFSNGNSRGYILDDDIEISADKFQYNKNLNFFSAKNNVLVFDKARNLKIYSDKVEYFLTKKEIFTKGNSRAVEIDTKEEIKANNFSYNIKKNEIIANKNVVVINPVKNYKIFSDQITYLKNQNKIFTKGKTEAQIESKYNFYSEDVVFDKNLMKLISNKNTTITNQSNLYNLKKFKYFIDNKRLKGEKITITTNHKSPNFDKFYFSNAMIDLERENFLAKNTEIEIHKNIFNDPENDPRIKGTTSKKKDEVITINNGIFTSCKKDDNCPPWSIQAKKIRHNSKKKQLIYDNALLKIYDFPIFYFPKFFHPDPTVKRQSGFLKPQINNSDELGDSLHVPYFHVISSSKDLTFKPTLFNNGLKMLQNEYRQKTKNSYLRSDFSLTTNYKSKLSNDKNSISHLFTKFNSDLNFKNFDTSDFELSIQKVTNDTYLKVFDSNLLQTKLKPNDQNNLSSEIKLTLSNKNYSFSSGMKAFENLGKKNNDRYEFILPYYDFSSTYYVDYLKSYLNFTSSASNSLKNTNQMQSKIINNFDLKFKEKITKTGFVNNFNVYFKNTNLLGKNDASYKSSPQIELMNLYEFNSKFPLQKNTQNFKNTIIPKISFKFNPSDMKNYSNAKKNVNVDNIFNVNRLGLDDSFEKGKSITLGLNFKKEKLQDINKYFEFKLANVFRDKEENFIPSTSSLNKKNSNLFGSAESKLSDNLSLNYKFRIDNNYDRIEYNSISTNLTFGNFETDFIFVEESGDIGDENFLENNTKFSLNENNFVSFSTRRNRKINLTEFYNLTYEYKNDCLVASIKYNKKYYSDRELKPSENLLFTITLIPVTTYEHNETNLFKN